MWLALPLVALRHWQVWDQLPASMATHFDAANHPNGWMTREASLWFAVGLMAFLLTIFTVVLYVAQRYPLRPSSWALLAFFYLVVGLIFYVENGVIDYNLHGQPINVSAFGIILAVGIVGLLAVFLGSARGKALPPGDLLTEEIHAARGWALVFIVPLVAMAGIFVTAPNTGMRVAMGSVGLILLVSLAMTWDGFHYLFTRHGVEIRTLGFRLKSIPLGQIKQYTVQHWSPIGGYGIRGVGGLQAYVWTNKGVRIETYEGVVFLGSAEPQRLVQDLDMMMKLSHS
jgi:hypothetical protein